MLILKLNHFKNNIMRKLFLLSMLLMTATFGMISCKSESTTTTETTTTETTVVTEDTAKDMEMTDTMIVDSTINETKPTYRPN